MPRIDRRVWRFLLIAAGLLTILLLPWPGLGRMVTLAFVSIANGTAGHIPLRSPFAFGFENLSDPGSAGSALGPWHAALVVRNEATDAATRSALNLRSLAFVPFAVSLALTLAAPMRANRLWVRSVALSAAALLVFVLVSIVLAVLSVLTSERIGAVDVGSLGRSIVLALFWTICETQVAAALFLWLAVRRLTIPGEDWLFLADSASGMSRAPRAPRAPRAHRAPNQSAPNKSASSSKPNVRFASPAVGRRGARR
jgi:hypothetical protein